MILVEYGTALNDALLPRRVDLEPRLRALAPLIVGTSRRPDIDRLAGLTAMRWLVCVYAPTWLRISGLSDHAVTLMGCTINSWEDTPNDQITAAYTAVVGGGARIHFGAAAVISAPAHYAAWYAGRAEAGGLLSPLGVYSSLTRARDLGTIIASRLPRDVSILTVQTLQESALQVFEQMVALYHKESP
jgi:hypothetical protein